MAYSIKKEDQIKYEPNELINFSLLTYEWIDNLNFTLNPNEVLPNSDDYVQVARELFLSAGWDGDGEIELMWIPPFMLENTKMENPYHGVILWHVKQEEDGTSWILSPVKLPF